MESLGKLIDFQVFLLYRGHLFPNVIGSMLHETYEFSFLNIDKWE